jgi:alanine racemase
VSAPRPDAVSPRRTWVEVSADAIGHNVHTLRGVVGPSVRLMPVIKGNAYGHGLTLSAHAIMAAGADGLCVDSLHEASALRAAHITAPLYVLGYVPPVDAAHLISLRASAVLYGQAEADAFAAAALAAGWSLPVHIKVETGNNRQGLPPAEAIALAQAVSRTPGLHLEGVSSHFANVEDTTDHSYARRQLSIFRDVLGDLSALGLGPALPNIANSAATLLWPEAHFGLVRPGIATFGMWPSRETLLSTMLAGRAPVTLSPALSWRSLIAQIKDLGAGECVGYGCTFQTTHPTRLAIVPVGYYDGYDRRLSNAAHVLIDGQRAPVRGRVCMNILMVDVTHIPTACVGARVTLLGACLNATIHAEDIAAWMGTINYEVTTRIHEAIPRLLTTTTP